MTVTIRVRGTREQVKARLRQIGPTLAGVVRDIQSVVPEVFLAMGMAMLGCVHAHYDRLSQGGTGDDGTVWPELSPVTLGLRDKVTTPKAIRDLMSEVSKAPAYRQRMFQRNLAKMSAVFETGASDDGSKKFGAVVRARALKILELMKPHITEARYDRTKRQLELLSERGKPNRKGKKEYFERVATAAAGGLILRDTGRLFNSLNPMLKVPNDTVAKITPGAIEVGTNVEYAPFHQSDAPRKMKKDGSGPVLPRRNFIPDVTPDAWVKEVAATLKDTLASPAFLVRFLGPLVAA